MPYGLQDPSDYLAPPIPAISLTGPSSMPLPHSAMGHLSPHMTIQPSPLSSVQLPSSIIHAYNLACEPTSPHPMISTSAHEGLVSPS